MRTEEIAEVLFDEALARVAAAEHDLLLEPSRDDIGLWMLRRAQT
jgi:hypothetical protein